MHFIKVSVFTKSYNSPHISAHTVNNNRSHNCNGIISSIFVIAVAPEYFTVFQHIRQCRISRYFRIRFHIAQAFAYSFFIGYYCSYIVSLYLIIKLFKHRQNPFFIFYLALIGYIHFIIKYRIHLF